MKTWFVVVVLAVLFGACGSDDTTTVATPTSTSEATVSDSTATTTFVQVEVDSLGTEHVDPPASFSNSPSIGGDHYPFWQNCGFYDVPVIEGAATHSLEHGAVWITYNTSVLSDDEVEVLRTMAEGNDRLLISPYDHPEGLILSAWGVQLRTSFDPNAPEVGEFIETWADNPELVEAGVSCQRAAGVPPSDARTLDSGEVVPAEYG